MSVWLSRRLPCNQRYDRSWRYPVIYPVCKNFTQPIQQIAQVANMLQSTAAASERVFEFLEEKEEDQTAENPVSVDKLQGNVEFEHVNFGYNPDQINHQ